MVGQPFKLLDFQRRFILEVYDNPAGTRRAYLSIGRKNGKTALMAALLLAHICGPEALQNSQIVSGAMSRDQAAIVFDLARKMILQSPELTGRTRIIPSGKRIFGLGKNVEFRALAADGTTAHGLSPVVAILDEVGQVKGDKSAFIEAIETSQGAYSEPLLIAISTQAPTDGDLFSRWLDEAGDNPTIVKHLYAADQGADVDDWDALKAANPALGVTPTIDYMRTQMERAKQSPSFETSFRHLHLNQRVSSDDPFVSRNVWEGCGHQPVIEDGSPVWLGLDLSSVSDLTALVMVAQVEGVWQVVPTFWLPADGLEEKTKQDRRPYTQWRDEGWLEVTPGKTVDYGWVAERLREVWAIYDVQGLAFDRWRWKSLEARMRDAGFDDAELALTTEFGQGFRDMSPALDGLEADLLNGRIAHGNHPVLTMCAQNATVRSDPAGNRKLVKPRERHRRIDGMIALAMAHSIAQGGGADQEISPWDADPTFELVL